MCLACYLENVPKKVLSFIWPGISYETALDKAASLLPNQLGRN